MNVRHARKTTLQESIEQALRSAGTLENRRVEQTSAREQARVSACANERASQNETLRSSYARAHHRLKCDERAPLHTCVCALARRRRERVCIQI